jgi:hypothetical protein
MAGLIALILPLAGRFATAQSRIRELDIEARPPSGRESRCAMIKFALPVESSNDAIRNGKLQKVFQ